MARLRNKLSNAELKAKPAGKFPDGGGLWFHKRDDGRAQWFLTYTIYGRRHEMGLGGYPDISLKQARQEAEKWQTVVRGGKCHQRKRAPEARI